ncbi:polysaccharide lyase domain-containing protein [Stakelama tenebrarum]|uniref:Right-handed parallel beta-helix repeat-containing protein n=1 Tax=Stakelama tenebrarum TaxID=2711215 RepID=A0A6G6Y9Q5_9SPHN|nr:right-handed parallel beta-helix repeat-containing protein [Sphingosinithalassobacter tenebrarum]QIG81306.1 right-handed parallel beta-helix repeat-containing protein [Sphingosinithalassobacter tenebrarum]
MRRLLPVIAIALTAPAAAQQGSGAPFVIEQTGQGFATLDAAVSAVRDGDATILIAPGTYRDCTVQTGGDITYRAIQPGSVIFDGGTCEGKAAFVLRGRRSVVDGIIFRNMRVPDGNGAGVRIETGDLFVSNSMFLDSQEGILGGGHETIRTIAIDHSTFAGLGQCDETVDCSHSIYLGLSQGVIRITNSRFERGTGGHYVKIRAPQVVIADSSFDDSQGRNTNYMIDMSEGGTGRITGNTFVQGPNKENWTALIVVGAEARTYGSAGLVVSDNVATLAPGVERGPAFVATTARDAVRMENNRLGQGIRPFEQR